MCVCVCVCVCIFKSLVDSTDFTDSLSPASSVKLSIVNNLAAHAY